MTLMLPLPCFMVLMVHLRVGLSQYVILERASQRTPRPQRLLLLFEGEHLEQAQTSWFAPISLKGKPLGSHLVGIRYHV